MRKLASIQVIGSLSPISGADKVEKATVLGWELVVKKGEFNIGDKCVYVEIDSVLPERPEFEFMRERKFRVKTIRLRGQVSQGIAFPMSILPDSASALNVGDDVSGMLCIEKWEPNQDERGFNAQHKKTVLRIPGWLPKWVRRIIAKSFLRRFFMPKVHDKTFCPYVPKTDETRVQVLGDLVQKYIGMPFTVTEKIDGSSITVYKYKNKVGVCSRNVDLSKDMSNKFWAAAYSSGIITALNNTNENIAIQGELIGPGVQGNKYGLSEYAVLVFNVFNIDKQSYSTTEDSLIWCRKNGIEHVPVLAVVPLPGTIEEIVAMAKGDSVLSKIPREGVVLRPEAGDIRDLEFSGLVANRVSFKAINTDFLIKYDL